MAYKFKERLIYFLDNGYWHGIRFLGTRCQTIGRLFWFSVIVISGLGMAVIFRFTLQNFQQDVINVNIETSYLHWTNTFPAISICLTKGHRYVGPFTLPPLTALDTQITIVIQLINAGLSATKIQNFMKSYWESNNITSSKSGDIAFAMWARDYLFVSPNINIDENKYCDGQNSTCGLDVNTLKKMKCSDFMTNLTYLGRPHNCNNIFKPINTEMGQCFTANSLHIYKDVSNLPLLYDQSQNNRVLSFEYNEKSDFFKILMYIHSPDELPYFDMEPISLHQYVKQHYFVETIEIVNSNVRQESIDNRNCRFPDEKMENSVLMYSFSSCFTEKRVALELELCNCTIYTSPIEYNDSYCDYKGLICLQHEEIPERIKKNYKSSEKPMCTQSCIEMEINSLGEIVQPIDEETEQSAVVIEVLNKPTLRYVRNVTKTRLDFVVSIGGLVGLFFGASLLSLVELAYIWLIRKF